MNIHTPQKLLYINNCIIIYKFNFGKIQIISHTKISFFYIFKCMTVNLLQSHEWSFICYEKVALLL